MHRLFVFCMHVTILDSYRHDQKEDHFETSYSMLRHGMGN